MLTASFIKHCTLLYYYNCQAIVVSILFGTDKKILGIYKYIIIWDDFLFWNIHKYYFSKKLIWNNFCCEVSKLSHNHILDYINVFYNTYKY